MSATLFEKIWTNHVVTDRDDESLIYVDRVLLQENSFHAFDKIRREQRSVRNPAQAFAFSDHYVPTRNRELGLGGITDPEIRNMVELIASDTDAYGIELFGIGHDYQGILHVVGPEYGITQPGLVIAGADSHTSTHGALGAYAFGIGSSEVAHVLATQTLWRSKPRTLQITVTGERQPGVSSKDLILYLIRTIGSGGAVGYAVEYTGDTIEQLSIEARMTVCNMSIEAGARAGLIAPDEKTFDYMRGKPLIPTGSAWDQAMQHWQTLKTDDQATFDRDVRIDATAIVPQVTWGTNPEMVVDVTGTIPDPAKENDLERRARMERALEYMGLQPDQSIQSIPLDRVFIGSCTNSRLEDLRIAARVMDGQTCRLPTMIVPGSEQVKRAAEAEGLHQIFENAGAEWLAPGCSMCVAINGDKLGPGERAASTSNRNFEGRQGQGGRTHLVSPAMAAAAAITGQFDNISNYSEARSWNL
ncbi:MAG: 3-isopropylmalate dehydratase large subunit [Litoricola sp.]|mgnify:FL=1|jgi:3-isopropylmalate/(R)-2-methylmalate dehydratase large subunit|nr:3-isopropylmalate dehydratase large subunit [Litorivicinus sp.]MDA0895045.1 3-isopropylmalate dehydratase large subunit [Pseudomonadota bacterium]MDF1783323.1 3-isopropylmalate dehydratase large subunit [Litorivicinaceae bacterium]